MLINDHFNIYDHQSILLVHPKTDRAEAWFIENVENPMRWGSSFVIEPRYLENILLGFTNDVFESAQDVLFGEL